MSHKFACLNSDGNMKVALCPVPSNANLPYPPGSGSTCSESQKEVSMANPFLLSV